MRLEVLDGFSHLRIPAHTVEGRNPANHMVCIKLCISWDKLYLSTGAEFLPSTVGGFSWYGQIMIDCTLAWWLTHPKRVSWVQKACPKVWDPQVSTQNNAVLCCFCFCSIPKHSFWEWSMYLHENPFEINHSFIGKYTKSSHWVFWIFKLMELRASHTSPFFDVTCYRN